METFSGRLTHLVTGGSGVEGTGSFGLALQMGSDQSLFPSSESVVDMETFGLTLRMSHEGERVTCARIQDQADRAPSHWLNPLYSAKLSALQIYPKLDCRIGTEQTPSRTTACRLCVQ